MHQLLQQNYSLEVFLLVTKCIFDLIICLMLVYTYVGGQQYYIYILVLLFFVGTETGLLYFLQQLAAASINWYLMVQIGGIALSMVLFILNGPKFQNFLLRSSQQVTLGLYQIIISISRAIPFRVFSSVQIILYFALITQNFFFIELDLINLQTFIIDSVLQLVFFTLLILASHNREMKVRRQYN